MRLASSTAPAGRDRPGYRPGPVGSPTFIVKLKNKGACYDESRRRTALAVDDMTTHFVIYFSNVLPTARTRTATRPTCARAAAGRSLPARIASTGQLAGAAHHIVDMSAAPTASRCRVGACGPTGPGYGDRWMRDHDSGTIIVENLPKRRHDVCFFPDRHPAGRGGTIRPQGYSADCVGRGLSTASSARSAMSISPRRDGVSGVVRGPTGRPIPNVSRSTSRASARTAAGLQPTPTPTPRPLTRRSTCRPGGSKCSPRATSSFTSVLRADAHAARRRNTVTPHMTRRCSSHHNTLRVVAGTPTDTGWPASTPYCSAAAGRAIGDCLAQPLAGARRSVYTSDVTERARQVTWRRPRPPGKNQLCLEADHMGTR